ncbi:NAD(P)H-hydrate dehydratase [bacterium 210820-DFI.6.37]|nr:NAD(P)H-hydrate dehydratase [bacterium 210820-DFI.6.37]
MEKPGLITREYVNTVIKERPRDIHKGDCGKVLIIAGSVGMAGAAMLCARGALRSGAGLVRISAPKELYPVLQTGVPEATCVPRELSLLDFMACDAIAIGPGLGDDGQSAELIRTILKEYRKTIVLDADGINAVSRFDLGQELRQTGAQVIMTPHPGEAARFLAYCGIDMSGMRRPAAAKALAAASGAVCVLKGSGSLVATQDGNSYINTTGNPGMATGGSGDVLTGIIAALAGQGLDPADCAKAGVFLHGMAGDLCAASLGETGMTALDLANQTALAFKEIIGK